jgi:hypothetical protein
LDKRYRNGHYFKYAIWFHYKRVYFRECGQEILEYLAEVYGPLETWNDSCTEMIRNLQYDVVTYRSESKSWIYLKEDTLVPFIIMKFDFLK